MNATRLIASSYMCSQFNYLAQAVPITSYIAATLIVVLLDLIRCFGEEHTYIWRSPFTCIKATYVLARYFPIFVHLANICLFAYLATPFPLELCQKWFLFQHLSTLLVQIPFDAVLCLRVYALYNYNIAIGILAIAMVVTDATASLLSGIYLHHQAEFGLLCSTRQAKFSLISPFTFQAFQSLMWGLTSYKRILIKGRLGPGPHTDIPYLPFVFRDGSLVLAGVTLSFALSVPYSALVHLETHMLYPWATTLLSIFCCRMVLNIHANATTETDTQNIELDDLDETASHKASPATN